MKKFFSSLAIPHYLYSKVSVCWFIRFFYQIGFILSWVVLTSTFVETFGITKILWLFLADGLLVLTGSLFSSYLYQKINSRKFLLITTTLTIFTVCLAFFLSANKWIFFSTIILAKNFFFAQLKIGLLRNEESCFSPAQAQKCLPIIESASTIGTIVSSLLFLELLKFFNLQQIIFFWIIPLIGMFITVWYLPKIIKDLPHFITQKTQKVSSFFNILEIFKSTWKVKFLRYLIFSVAFQTTIFTITEYEFLSSVDEHTSHNDEIHFSFAPETLQANMFSDSMSKITSHAKTISHKTKNAFANETLAHDLGFLSLIFGLIALVVQCCLASKILAKFGIINSMLIFWSGAISFIGLFLFGLVGMNFVRGFQHGFHSLTESSYHLSFYSILEHRREKIRHFFEGFIKPLGLIFATGLILYTNAFGIYYPAVILLICSGILLLNIEKKRNSFTNLSQRNLEKATLIEEKLHAIETLGQKGHLNAHKHLASYLYDKNLNPIIREKIISVLTKINNPETIHSLINVLYDTKHNNEIKKSILEALLEFRSLPQYLTKKAFCRYKFLETLNNLFKSTREHYLKKLIVMNVFTHLSVEQIVPYFKKIMNSKDERIQAICLRSCAEYDDPEIISYIKPYLSHKNYEILGHTIIALWRFDDRELLRKEIYNLLENSSESSHITALYCIGEIKDKTFINEIKEFCLHDSPLVQIHAAVALAKLQDPEATKLLTKIITGENKTLSTMTYQMIKRTPIKIREKIYSQITKEISIKVSYILSKANVHNQNCLSRVPQSIKTELKYWYQLAKRYDDLSVLEKTE